MGLRGAAVISAQKNYNACFIVDVDYATDTLTPHDNQMGSLSLGKGVGLHIKADNNPVLRRITCESAKKQKIDYQLSVGRFPYGGTDATPIQLNGVATLNINIPCRYMHSPIEICHRNDIESAVNLLISTIESIGQRSAHTFIPGID